MAEMYAVEEDPELARAAGALARTQWLDTAATAGANIAFGLEYVRLLGVDRARQVLGDDLLAQADIALKKFLELYSTAKKLDAHQAVLIPFYEQTGEGTRVYVAAIKTDGIPSGSTLAGCQVSGGALGVAPIVWAVALAATGTLIAGAAVLVKYWDYDVDRITEGVKKLNLEAIRRQQQFAEALLDAGDTAGAAQLANAASEALKEAAKAAAAPQTYFDRFLSAASGVISSAVNQGPLILLLLLALANKKK